MNPLSETLSAFGRTVGTILGVAASIWLLNEWHEYYIRSRIERSKKEHDTCPAPQEKL